VYKHHGIRFAAAAALLAAVGCAHEVTSASFRGSPVPVLLGARDRVGPATAPLQATPVRDFETEASWTWSQSNTRSDYGRYVVETHVEKTEQTGKFKLQYDLSMATHDAPGLEVRLTKVKPAAYGAFAGLRMKHYVEVDGQVVQVKQPEAK
jgi:hypothetical protein